jgi:hypothetical protein
MNLSELRTLLIEQVAECRRGELRIRQFDEMTEFHREEMVDGLAEVRNVLVSTIELFNADAAAAGLESIEAP